MWIVRLALRRPYTFVVAALALVLLGAVTISRTPTDIFPSINIPVASVIWSYAGMPPDDMAERVVTINERAITTTVGDIEHIESQSMQGVSVIKVFFQPGANIAAAVAQLTANAQTILRVLPPGITPPLILQYSASNVPILQLGVSSQTLSEAQLYDYGLNFIRTQLATVQGASVPLPYGGYNGRSWSIWCRRPCWPRGCRRPTSAPRSTHRISFYRRAPRRWASASTLCSSIVAPMP
jgi:multidrug efflux pump subunit AcrB